MTKLKIGQRYLVKGPCDGGTKFKVGQKYLVIKDCTDSERNGKIITVKEVYRTGKGFYDENGNYFNFNDILKLIKDKKVKGVSKTNYNIYRAGDTVYIEHSKIDCSGIGFSINQLEGIINKLQEILEEPKKESKEIEKIDIDESKRNYIKLHNEFLFADKINELVEQVNKLSKEK